MFKYFSNNNFLMVNYGTKNETFPSEYTQNFNRQNINQQHLPLASAKAKDDKRQTKN